MFSLKKLFGKEVRVTHEDWSKDEWCEQIVGKRGTIYPQSETTVCVETTMRIGKQLLAIFGSVASSRRECDEGIDIIIPLNCVRSTFRYIKPKKKWPRTEAQIVAAKRNLCPFAPRRNTGSQDVSS